MKNSIINYSLILILTCCLGSTFLFISISLTSFNPIASGSGRVILAAIFSVIFTFILGQKLPDNKRDWFFAFIYGVFFLSIPFSIIPYSLRFLDTSEVAIYLASIPLFILILARIFLNEIISFKKWIGFIIGVTGLIFLSGPENFIYKKDYNYLPPLLCILASILLAGGGIFIQKISKSSPLQITAASFLIGGIILLPLFLLNLPINFPSNYSIFGLIAVGIFSTFFGSLVRFVLIKRAGAVFTSINGFTSPIFSTLLGVLILDESLTSVRLISFSLILLGVFVAQDFDKLIKNKLFNHKNY